MIGIVLGLLLAQAAPLEPTPRVKAEEYAWRVDFMPGGRIVLVAGRERGGSTAALVEIATGKTVLRIDPGERRSVEYFALSRDRSADFLILILGRRLQGRKGGLAHLQKFPEGVSRCAG